MVGAPFVAAAEPSRIPMLFVKDGDHASKVVFANRSFLTLTGLTHSDLLGRPVFAVLEDLTDPATLAMIKASMRTGHPAIWEMQCHRRNGSAFFASVLVTSVCNEKNRHPGSTANRIQANEPRTYEVSGTIQF